MTLLSQSTTSYKQVTLSHLFLFTDRPFKGCGSDLRRAITSNWPDMDVLHNHGPFGGFYFRLPRIRYIVLAGRPIIVALNSGRPVLESIYGSVPFRLRDASGNLFVLACELNTETAPLGLDGVIRRYRSITPWLALNEVRFAEYKRLTKNSERKRLLERVLVGNFLSLAKGLGIFISRPIVVSITGVNSHPVWHKGTRMLGFWVSFQTNFFLPPLVGVGKLTSKGFGLFESLRTPGS